MNDGLTCLNCGEGFAPLEDKVPVPCFSAEGTRLLWSHRECMVRRVAGGINHLLRLCHCYGGDQPPDPPGLSAREAARLVTRYIDQRGCLP